MGSVCAGASGQNVSTNAKSSKWPPFTVCDKGDLSALRSLIDRKVDLNQTDLTGEYARKQIDNFGDKAKLDLSGNALHGAMGYLEHGDVDNLQQPVEQKIAVTKEMITLALQGGANPNMQRSDGKTPLVLLLSSRLAVDDTYDNPQKNAQIQAAIIDIVKLLVASKADVNTADLDGNDCLKHVLVKYAHTENLVRLLLESKAQVNAKNKKNHTALFACCTKRDGFASANEADLRRDRALQGSSIKILLEAKADINHAVEGKEVTYSALGVYASYRYMGFSGSESVRQSLFVATPQEDVVKILIEAKVQVNAQKRSPLHIFASNSPGRAAIDLLLAAGADLHQKTSDLGNTPLHLAAQNSQGPNAQLSLIEAKADVEANNDKGKTPLQCACDAGLCRNSLSLAQQGAVVTQECVAALREKLSKVKDLTKQEKDQVLDTAAKLQAMIK